MSPPNRPFSSALPGINDLTLSVDKSACKATFFDKIGKAQTLTYSFWQDDGDEVLTIEASDGSVCSFRTCPPPNQALWFASGLFVVTQRTGIASHIYALCRDLLKPRGAAITPSGNLFPDGVALWRILDPEVEFREQDNLPGYFEPIA
jgi:hypothetical protein